MKFAIVLLCLAVFVQAVFGETFGNTEDEAWQNFKLKHRKGLKGPAEALRKRNFVSRWKAVTEHNKQFAAGQVTFKVDLGEDADVSLDELRRFRNGRAPNLSNGTSVSLKLSKNLRGTLPASWDWRNKGAVTPVKQQGGCGSCYTFSTAAYLESQMLLAGKAVTDLAEQQSVDCSQSFGNNGCGGGLEINVFRYYQTTSQQTEDTYKYTGRVGQCRATGSGKVKVSKSYNVQRVTRDVLKNLLVTKGPICVGMYASDNLLQDYRSGIYSCARCPTSPAALDHAVLLVGYGTENGREYWLIKNSWGVNWGMNGYVKIAMANNNVGIMSDITYADVQFL